MQYDAIEDDDLLAPKGVATGAEDDDADEFAGDWQPAHGFPDTRRAVRIWVDEDTRRLRRVRLSTRWRERLGTARLEDAFAEAFFLANARVGGIDDLAAPTIEVPEGIRRSPGTTTRGSAPGSRSCWTAPPSWPTDLRRRSVGPTSAGRRSPPPAPTAMPPSHSHWRA
ncbi:hypothetical protein G7085_00780 [Tessaracoccus sp. HDW20]|uniref:hypothetical protein n=1 Tax=Tessaracoccus coleopterorum TaxID=2714950 RepID=UPI0018D36617|nr:hypothetical protein [Tessaracoccus coleopterorum]NHB83728.1 hypothetical protein [Tessaracoccus coleopterorum]